MRRITAIPSKRITFHNVPISGLFFLKRTLYKKNSVREASKYNCSDPIFFAPNETVKYIAKQHENIAIDLYESKINDDEKLEINDIIEIISKESCGRIVSMTAKNCCTVQYKDKDTNSICYKEFPMNDLRKVNK